MVLKVVDVVVTRPQIIWDAILDTREPTDVEPAVTPHGGYVFRHTCMFVVLDKVLSEIASGVLG